VYAGCGVGWSRAPRGRRKEWRNAVRLECSWLRIGLPWWVKKKAKEGEIILYRDWCLEWISLSYTKLHITSIYFHRIHCRSIVLLRDHTGVKNSRTLARRPVQFSAGPGGSRSCGCCSSRQNKLVQFSFYSGLVCYHIPVSHPSSDR
jgi:hypothetical protein